MRIAKSSKEQDGYEAPDTTGARLSPEAPEGTAGATSKVAPNELAKPVLVSRGAKKIFGQCDVYRLVHRFIRRECGIWPLSKHARVWSGRHD